MGIHQSQKSPTVVAVGTACLLQEGLSATSKTPMPMPTHAYANCGCLIPLCLSNFFSRSVLMHLLPGLAVFAHRHHTPTGLRGLKGLAAAAGALLQGRQPDVGQLPAAQQASPLVLWLVVAPLAFYITWQLLYFLVVQVGFCGDAGVD